MKKLTILCFLLMAAILDIDLVVPLGVAIAILYNGGKPGSDTAEDKGDSHVTK